MNGWLEERLQVSHWDYFGPLTGTTAARGLVSGKGSHLLG